MYRNCILCDALSGDDFCDACFKNLPRLTNHYCAICSKILTVHEDQYCGNCLNKPPAYSATVAALHYTFPVDVLIHALKYKMQLTIAPILAKLLIDRLNAMEMNNLPDMVIPVPLHPKRMQQRGFNQALEISRHVTRKIDIKLLVHGCKRIKNTPPQTELPWKLRNKNVKQAFSCTADLSGMHVAVIDDVMTTGATLNALAHQFRKQGANKITNWVIARTQPGQFLTASDYY